MKIILILSFAFISLIPAIAQNKESSFSEIRAARPWGISGNIGGNSVFFGASVSRYINDRLEWDLSFGYALSYAVTTGITYYFPRNKISHWNTYTGIHLISFGVVDYSFSFYSTEDDNHTEWAGGAYLPVGIQYCGPEGFTFNVDAGVLSAIKDGFRAIPFGGIRIGYRFARNSG